MYAYSSTAIKFKIRFIEARAKNLCVNSKNITFYCHVKNLKAPFTSTKLSVISLRALHMYAIAYS